MLRTLSRFEKPVSSTETDALYIMRILPYRTSMGVISGVVLTFTDVTRATAAEAKVEELTRDLRTRLGNLETLLELLPVGVFLIEDEPRSRVLANRCGARLLGASEEGRGLRPLSPACSGCSRTETDCRYAQRELADPDTGRSTSILEARLQRADGTSLFVMVSAAPLFDDSGRPSWRHRRDHGRVVSQEGGSTAAGLCCMSCSIG